ncbi:MAG: glycoside hydrolase family 88/105 protein, partial [Chitinophagaceae bacterium]
MKNWFHYLNLSFKRCSFSFLLISILISCSGPHRAQKGVESSAQAQSKQSVFNIMKKVATWQIDSIREKGWRHPERNWTMGAMYTGLMAYAALAHDSSIYHFMKNEVGEKYNWQIIQGPDRYFADNYCVGQMYCGMYEIYHDPQMIADLKDLADTLIARPHTESLEWKNKINLREWAWCDGLFMGPPTLAMLAHVTQEKKYMDLVDSLWWKTTDYLYDPKEHLYYRDSRYFDKREKNGQKVFWSRGNGWVMGGLVRVLQNMPENYYDRPRWIKLYRNMAEKIASIQQPDGTWHASLLDPGSYPIKETSGSGFFCYALAWGINHHLLDGRKYAPVVWRSWNALVGCVHPDGMLG